MTALPIMFIVWAAFATCFVLLLVYRGNLTRYEEDQLFLSDNNRTELLLIPPLPSYNTEFPRLVLGSQKASEANMGIKIRVQLATFSTN